MNDKNEVEKVYVLEFVLAMMNSVPPASDIFLQLTERYHTDDVKS